MKQELARMIGNAALQVLAEPAARHPRGAIRDGSAW